MGVSNEKKRPDTFAGCLLDLAEWLDACDLYIRTYGPAGADGCGSSDEAQQDLRRLAQGLLGEPELDHRLMELMGTSDIEQPATRVNERSCDWILQLSAKSQDVLAKLPSRFQPTWYRLRITEANKDD